MCPPRTQRRGARHIYREQVSKRGARTGRGHDSFIEAHEADTGTRSVHGRSHGIGGGTGTVRGVGTRGGWTSACASGQLRDA
eukprot:8413789-Alexandrium_andersonii.AAC.1